MRDDQQVDPSQTTLFGSTGPEISLGTETIPLNVRDREAVDALPPGNALLIVQRGPNAGARFLLAAAVTSAGRSPVSDIFLDDVTVSRKHCQFIAQDGGHIVRDSGALNGTYVNRERVDQAVLHAGDEVQIGKYRMTYQPAPEKI